MGVSDATPSIGKELESALSPEKGPDMGRVTGVLDAFLQGIRYASEVAEVAQKTFGEDESPTLTLAHGIFWTRVGHWIRARQILEKQAVHERRLPEPLEGFVWFCLAECEYKLRRFDAAQGTMQRARYIAEKTGHGQLKALSLLLAAKIAFKQSALDEVQSRVEEARRAVRPAYAWSIPSTLADIQGTVEISYGRADSARAALLEAEELARSAGDTRALAVVLRDILRLHLLTENREKAEKTISRGLEIAWEAHDWLGEAALLAMEADLFNSEKEYDAAERRFKESLKINEALDYGPGQAICAVSMARNAIAQRRRDKAREYLDKGLQILEATGVPRHRSDAKLVHAILGEADGAEDTEERYRELKESFAACPHGYRYARSLFNYGCYLAKKGKIDEAAQLLAESYEKAAPLQAPMLGRIRDLLTMPSKQWSGLWSGLYRRLQTRSSELESAKMMLERITRQRKGATAMLVHDLKNQLSSLVASLGTAKALGVPLPLGDKDYVPLLLAYARTITGRVESLTDFWKSEIEGELKPNLAETDMGEILAAVQMIGELLEVSDIQWTLAAPPSPPTITCDAQQIQRVFENLLFNARTYTQAVHTGKRYVDVDVQWDEANQEMRTSITNSGPTIPVDKLEEIFERFVRVSYDDRDEIKVSLFHRAHVGLGLFYCRQVLTVHGGRIWAENLEDGSGVRFTFILPRRPPETQ